MGCKECGKPKCNGECGCKSPKVLQINNPAEYITFHKVSIPAAMGDSTTNPPKIGAYRNALVYYEADHTSWMYSTDGIPTLVTGEKGDPGDCPDKLSQLENDTGFITASTDALVNYYTKTETDNAIDNKADKAVVERKSFYFNSLAEMKAYDLNDGDLAITTGYYFADDGGAAEYIVTDEELTADDAFVVALANGNFAKLLVKDNCINIRQIGARSQDAQNNKYDIADYISAYITYLDTVKDRVKLYIPSGVWYSSELTIHRANGFNIIGDEQFVHWINGGTIISSLEDNQNFIFKLGDLSSMMGNFTLKNICFTTADFVFDATNNHFATSVARIKDIAQYCVVIQGCEFGDIDNLYFQHINGQALEIATAWEIRYRKLYFRDIDSHAGCIMKFGEKRTTLPISYVGGVNASSFDNLMFEQVLGHLIELDYHCELVNCYFGVINFEDNKITRTGVTYTNFTSSNISDYEASNPTRYAMFYGGRSGITFHTCVINSIQLNNISSWYSTIDGANYCYDNLFRFIGDWSLYQIVINNIDSLGIKKDATILYSHDKVDYRSSFIINNLNNTVNNNYEFIYDVDFFRYIRNDGRIRAITNSWVARLPESATPAYKLVVNRDKSQGKLKSDSDAQNELKLCVKLVDSGTSMSFYNCSDKLAIRAKIPDGETAAIGISGAVQQNVDLEGTGSFKVYEIALSSNRKIGDLTHISYRRENTATSCLIDYIIN